VTLSLFCAAMELCDPGLGGHAERVGSHARAIGKRLGWSEAQLDHLELGAALHDVGKVSIPSDVLVKPGRLDEHELAQIRTHPVEGMWLIAGVQSLAPALPYVLFHHERWDGPSRRSSAVRARSSTRRSRRHSSTRSPRARSASPPDLREIIRPHSLPQSPS
jgi:hypothetical protein